MIVNAKQTLPVEVPAVLLSRARSEYLGMIEMDMSELVLTELAASGFLWRTREGAYVRCAAR